MQGAGLAGSDLRNGYLYSKGLSLAEVHGTTALIGASNFLIATIIRLYTHQLTIPNLLPILYLTPLILIATWVGRFSIGKINKELTNKLIIVIMALITISLVLRIMKII